MRAGAMVINLDVVHEARYGELPGVWLRIRSRILKYDPNKPYLKLVRETRRADTGAVVQIKEQPPQWWADLLEKRIELEFAEYEGGQPRPAKGRHFDGRWRNGDLTTGTTHRIKEQKTGKPEKIGMLNGHGFEATHSSRLLSLESHFFLRQ